VGNGYVGCQDMNSSQRGNIVYSFGVNVDSSFEEAFLSDTNARLIAVDFSVNSVWPPYAHWEQPKANLCL